MALKQNKRFIKTKKSTIDSDPGKALAAFSTGQETRRFITIDGDKYFLKHMDEFGLADQAQFLGCAKRMQKYLESGGADETDAVDAGVALSSIFNKIVIDAEPVAKKLGDFKKLQVLQIFLKLAGLLDSTTTSSDASSGSQDSKGSMAVQ